MRSRRLAEDWHGRYWDYDLGPGPAPRTLIYHRWCTDQECLDQVSIEFDGAAWWVRHKPLFSPDRHDVEELGPFEKSQEAAAAAVDEGMAKAEIVGLER